MIILYEQIFLKEVQNDVNCVIPSKSSFKLMR